MVKWTHARLYPITRQRDNHRDDVSNGNRGLDRWLMTMGRYSSVVQQGTPNRKNRIYMLPFRIPVNLFYSIAAVLLLLLSRSHQEGWSAARAEHRTNRIHSARSRVSLVIRSMFAYIHFVMLVLYDVFGLPRLRFPLTFPWITYFTSSHPPCLIVCPKKESMRYTTTPRSCLVVLNR